MSFVFVCFSRQNATKHTCVIYYLSVDFCFMVRCFGLAQCPISIPHSLSLPVGMNSEKRKERAMINTKERLLSFFSAPTQPPPRRFFWKPGNGRGMHAEKESTIEKERKTLACLLLLFASPQNTAQRMHSIRKCRFC
jgi:hypothetical protein